MAFDVNLAASPGPLTRPHALWEQDPPPLSNKPHAALLVN